MLTTLRRYARYNVWANQTLLRDLAALDDAAYHGHAGLCFRSIHGTVNHILLADQFWYGLLTKTPLDPRIQAHLSKQDKFAKPGDAGIYWEDYVRERSAVSNTLVNQAELFASYVETLTTIDTNVEIKTSGGNSMHKPLGTLLMHVVNHGTHHRGQVTAAMTALGLPPPSIDFIYYNEGSA